MEFRISFYILVIFCLSEARGQSHPLDPLSSAEIEASVKIIQNTFPYLQNQGWKFSWITLKEPEKSLLLPSFIGGTNTGINSIPRKAFVILLHRPTNNGTEVVVNLNTKLVETSTKLLNGTQIFYNDEDTTIATRVVVNNKNITDRCAKEGWTDMNNVVASDWSITYKDNQLLQNALRPVIVFLYGQLFPGDNYFAHPFGFAAIVDLATEQLLKIEDLPTHSDYNATNTEGNICPKTPANYNPKFRDENLQRIGVKPIHFSQPGGPGYQLVGNEITWQKFKMRVGFNGREGVLIYHVSYKDGQIERPLFYRMSFAELFVIYGDPRPPFQRKFPFDQGQYTLGFNAINQEEAGVCLGGGKVAYLHADLNDEMGYAVRKHACICIYEEDTGLGWAHLDDDGTVIHTRSQRLTITSFYNVGNYDYIISWRFYQDATVEFHMQLHGIISTQLLAKGVSNAGEFGNAVAPQINGQYHQHNLGVRIDAEIGGNKNSVSTLDIVQLPSDPQTNPFGNGFTSQVTLLKTPAEARTNISPLTGRFWLIQNPDEIHPYTERPVTWKLAPHVGPPVPVQKDSPLHPFLAWTDYNVWVTKYKEEQFYPGGLYVNGSGLPVWVNEDPNIDITKTDVVLWYNFGFTHLPRTEDYPLMAREEASFQMKPLNFFLENPALDVPPTSKIQQNGINV